jgi:DNA topoisomerase-1
VSTSPTGSTTPPCARTTPSITIERAAELLAERRERGPAKKTAKKGAKKAPAKKSAAKKTAAKKTAKKAAAKKS